MIKATNKTILVSIFIGQKIYKTNLQYFLKNVFKSLACSFTITGTCHWIIAHAIRLLAHATKLLACATKLLARTTRFTVTCHRIPGTCRKISGMCQWLVVCCVLITTAVETKANGSEKTRTEVEESKRKWKKACGSEINWTEVRRCNWMLNGKF